MLCILALSAALTFSSAVDLIFAVGFILIALVVIAWTLKRLSAGLISGWSNNDSENCKQQNLML
ncbi:MAG: hypothetical protein ACFFB5_13680 [Promethearchaeota archaeon]